jgi:hypothetical protein
MLSSARLVTPLYQNRAVQHVYGCMPRIHPLVWLSSIMKRSRIRSLYFIPFIMYSSRILPINLTEMCFCPLTFIMCNVENYGPAELTIWLLLGDARV